MGRRGHCLRAGGETPRPFGLDLDVADAFKGFVLGVAIEECSGDREKAFALVGKEKLAKARNHHKVLRRELDRVVELCRLLGERTVPFARLAASEVDRRDEHDDSSSSSVRDKGTRDESP